MNQVLYWLTQNLSDISPDDSWLSEAERRVLAGKRFPKRHDDWKLGRWTAKQAICAFQSDQPPILSDLEIRAAADGAPEAFRNGAPAQVSVSISHSRRQSLCVVAAAGCGIGCDLEWIEPREAGFAADYFAPEEISVVQRSPAEAVLLVNLIWSAKETVLKILRKGMRLDTRSVRIDPDFHEMEGDWKSWTGYFPESPHVFQGWWRTGEGFIYTAASDQITAPPEQLKASA